MNIKLAPKLVIGFMLAAALPLCIVSWLINQQFSSTIRELQYSKLVTLAETRARQIDETIRERGRDAELLAGNPILVDAIAAFSEAVKSNGHESAQYSAVEHRFAAELKRHIQTLNFHDLLLINKDGDIVYTVAKERDLGTNLLTGPYSSSELARTFRSAVESKNMLCSEIRHYAPSNRPAIFLAAPVIQAEILHGVIAFQIPMEDIHALARDYTGLGKTGETVLASKEEHDVMMVAPTRHDPNAAFSRHVTIGSNDARPIQEAASGKDGSGQFTDYRGIPVIAAWKYLPFTKLGMVLKIDAQEVFSPVSGTTQSLIHIALGALAVSLTIALLMARSISRPILDLTQAAVRMADGDLSARTTINSADEVGQLATAFNNMATKLEEFRNSSLEQEWIQTGIVEVGTAIRGTKNLAELCNDIMSCLTPYVGAQVGTLSILKQDQLILTGSYAYTPPADNAQVTRISTGLAGQAVKEQKRILVTDIPDNYLTINSSLGKLSPNTIVCLPLVHEKNVNGLIEIGTIHPVSERQLKLLEHVAEHLAIAIHTAQSREQIQALLEESQVQAEELQSQQEELRVSNEELEEQTQALKKSEELLKKQQNDLQTTNVELEEKTESLEKQKQELTEAARQINRKAEELALASRYKSEFLANMSHELRTPLNSLLILAGVLAENNDGNLTDEQVEAAGIIQNSGNDLLCLINDILDLSKIEAGQVDLHLETVTTRELHTMVRSSFGHLIEKKGLKLAFTQEPDTPEELFTDGRRLGQILKNLVSNAVKFTHEGGITVSLSRHTLRSEPALSITVADTGIGIPKDKHSHVFEAFQQADGSTSRKYGGTGLGLSISRELTHLLCGEISLTSEEGKGTEFRVVVPLRHPQAVAQQPADPGIPEPAEPVPVRNTPLPPSSSHADPIGDDRDNLAPDDRVILIIEDDTVFAKQLAAECHRNNFKCLIAATGENGLGLAECYKPTAIILDLKLPDIHGEVILNRLKTTVHTRHIPVHIMSAADPVQKLINHGAIGFLQKPVSPESLKNAFGRITDMVGKTMKELLVIEDDDNLRTAILKLIGNGDVLGTGTGTGAGALEKMRLQNFDCIILDLNLPDMNGFHLLKTAEQDEQILLPPVIVYTGRELTREEEAQLSNYSESIIVKGVRSRERLFDEASLFLHRMVEKMPEPKRTMITNLHESDQIFSNRKVLVVDDDMRNLFALSNALTTKGIVPIKAQDGQKALQHLEANPDIDLVLMDIMMPVMDGYETIKQIRLQPRYENLAIIALTAKAMKEDRTKCLEAGANDYLPKPIDTDRLLSMMRVWMYR